MKGRPIRFKKNESHRMVNKEKSPWLLDASYNSKNEFQVKNYEFMYECTKNYKLKDGQQTDLNETF